MDNRKLNHRKKGGPSKYQKEFIPFDGDAFLKELQKEKREGTLSDNRAYDVLSDAQNDDSDK